MRVKAQLMLSKHICYIGCEMDLVRSNSFIPALMDTKAMRVLNWELEIMNSVEAIKAAPRYMRQSIG